MDLNQSFDEAVANSKTLSEKPGNNILFKLYAYYKQSTVGDANVNSPSNPLDFVANAKYNAWEALKGTPRETAMKDYIDLVTKLKV